MIDNNATGALMTVDGKPLKQSLASALKRQKIRALLLISPLLIFVLITFLFPIGSMLFRSVENNIVVEILPETVAALATWNGKSGELPNESVYAAFAGDIQRAAKNKSHTRVGLRLNYEKSGSASLFKKTARQAKKWDLEADAPFKEKLIAVHKSWGEVEIWQTLKTHSSTYTAGYFFNAVDMRKTLHGPEFQPENKQILIKLFQRTLIMSLMITVACILLGYPVAWLLANLPRSQSNLLMILVLLPFWTSLLVRTSAWKVMLQQQGVINDLFVALGIIEESGRLVMINNQFGTIIAMTHILLPFMILPMY